eukprot:scaffold22345_cov125-Isochrysis_galbana.AAC.1
MGGMRLTSLEEAREGRTCSASSLAVDPTHLVSAPTHTPPADRRRPPPALPSQPQPRDLVDSCARPIAAGVRLVLLPRGRRRDSAK